MFKKAKKIWRSVLSSSTFQAEQLPTIAQIQAQINAASTAGGGVVMIPAGTYLIEEQTLLVMPNVHLQGAGIGNTILKIRGKNTDGTSNNRKAISIDRANNTEVSGLTIDGNKQERPDLINDPNAHSLDVAWSDNFFIHDIEVINSASGSIVMYNSSHGIVQNNVIRNSGSNGILGLERMQYINVLNNQVLGTDNQNGIFFSFQTQSSSHIEIRGNLVRDSADYGIEVGNTTQQPGDLPHEFITVENNQVINSVCAGIGFRSVSNSLIQGNTIIDYGKIKDYGCNGIFVEGRVALNVNVDVRNNVITQNNPKPTSADPTPYTQAMYITGMDTMNITGNTINKSWSEAITVLASFFPGTTPDFPEGRRLYRNIHVDGNTITDSELSGIHFDGYPSSGNTVRNNIINRSGTVAIQIDPPLDRVEVSGNIIDQVPPGENLWQNPTSFNPLPLGFPSTNRQQLPAGDYTVSFDARSPSGAILNVYVQDRRFLDQHITLSNTLTHYSFQFILPQPDEILFWDELSRGDIEIHNISIVSNIIPRDPAYQQLIDELDALFITNPAKAREVVAVFQSILDLIEE